MRYVGAYAALLLMLAGPGNAAPLCLGDCDGDGVVTPAEYDFVRSCVIPIDVVPNALIIAPSSEECLACADADGDGSIAIVELIHVVNNAVMGCPGNPRCDGDCDGDRRVIVSELLYGLGAALNGVPADDPCPDFVFCPPGDACISISTLQRAVDNALRGCP